VWPEANSNLGLVSALALYLPASRAARIDPTSALAAE
jgi:ABC-type lipoprotein release transport system permease subunit